MICINFDGFRWFWQGGLHFQAFLTKYFESGSLFRIFHVYHIFSENQLVMEKNWILCRKYCWKHSHSSVMPWDLVIHLTFSTVFRHKIQDFSMMSWFSQKIWYTWKMRKSEPDTKYFVKSLENEVLPVKINENHRKLCKSFTVWLPKGIGDVQFVQVFTMMEGLTLKWRISTSGNLFSKIFFVSDPQIVYSKLYKNHCRYYWRNSRTH